MKSIKYSWIFWTVFLAGCGKDIVTPMTRPLSERNLEVESLVQAGEGPFCKPDAAGNYEAAPVVVHEKGQNALGHYYALGGGCVLKSLDDSWSASKKDSFFHWKKSELASVTPIVHVGADLAYSAVQYHKFGFLKFTWTIEWYHMVQRGSIDAPEQILIHYTKTDGTNHIRYFDGTIELTSLTPSVTSVILRNEVDADQTGLDNAMSSLSDLIDKLRN